MGLDFTATFALSPSFAGAAWLRDALAADTDAIPRVVELYRDRWRAQAWSVERARNGADRVIGPGGFAIDFSASAMQVYHLLRFSHFAFDENARAPLRRACFTIANLVDSPRAIYKHELYPCGFFDGSDLDAPGI